MLEIGYIVGIGIKEFGDISSKISVIFTGILSVLYKSFDFFLFISLTTAINIRPCGLL